MDGFGLHHRRRFIVVIVFVRVCGRRSCVELTQQAAAWIDDRQLANRIMNFSIAYAYTVKQILRRELLYAEDLEGIVCAAEVSKMRAVRTQRYILSIMLVVVPSLVRSWCW